MGDTYVKVVLTVIAGCLIWIAVNGRHKDASDEVTLNDLSAQITSVGSVVETIQQSVDNMASDVTDIKNKRP